MQNEQFEHEDSAVKPKLKSLPKRSLYAYMLLAFLGLVILVVAAREWTSDFIIENISVHGNYYLESEEVEMIISDKVLKKSKDQLDIAELESIIMSYPFIDKAYINFTSRDEIEIEIEENIPIALIKKEKQGLAYLDKNGQVIPFKLFKSHPDLILLSGVFKNNKSDTLALEKSFDLIMKLRDEKFRSIEKQISELIYTKDGFQLISDLGNSKILLGKNSHLEDKLKKLLKFWQNNLPDTNSKKYEYIDLRWKNQLVVKAN